MTGSLAIDLVSSPQRERGGQIAQERFDYQAFWGMMLLFRQHEAAGNYAVIFEFHDDLAVVDDPEAPAQIRFFQVKTKDKGSWSLADLMRRKELKDKKKDKKQNISGGQADEPEQPKRYAPSILGKMFHNIDQFGQRVSAVTFVSNAPCDLHSGQNFGFGDCPDVTLTKLVEAVQAEYESATDDEVKLLGFERADLSVQDGQTHMKGKLHEFVKRHVGAEQFPLDSLFRAIADECRKRSKFTGDTPKFSDVVRLKGITRAEVQTWLDEVKAVVTIPSWEELSASLSYPFVETTALRSAWRVYQAEVLNQADEALRAVRRAIRDRISKGFGTADQLMTVVEAIANDVRKLARMHLVPFKLERLRAMIIYELYTQDAA
ncbi:dsDNA nuclease domain-containing protein [Novosphingobium sp. KACC 22771]|uniref:dsDNA nuclease domain-containing protein n=1 Tax=Novosphingobium sp. KACC 22771 TaxID=3025670 RepID=UPI0023672551|nr:dsDNA nuclease domain-containing protein [Novosphingobium sp. KACC 22771]WDF75230.1 dsDNA nuclease domain-containing protein [Novosphingobium sp. KACC 22771]